MANSALIFTLIMLPAMALAYSRMERPLVLEGSVFCDTCVAKFETPASTPVAGAKVRVVCKERADTSKITYTQDATTDPKGNYKMYINEDRDDEVCDVFVVKSYQKDCATPMPERESARVILTRKNGMCSDSRKANAIGFTKLHPDRGCEQVMAQYKTDEEDSY